MRRPEMAGRPVSRLGRCRRRFGFDRNELRRQIDRTQWRTGLAMLVLFLLAAPAAAWFAAGWSLETGLRAEHRERATRYPVVVTVAGPAGLAATAADRYLHQTVLASWQAPDGTRRTGQLPAWKGARAGSRHQIWVDRAGAPVPRPRPHSRTVVDAGYAAAGAAMAAGLPLLCLYGLVRRRCDRRRYAAWDAEWARMDQPYIS